MFTIEFKFVSVCDTPIYNYNSIVQETAYNVSKELKVSVPQIINDELLGSLGSYTNYINFTGNRVGPRIEYSISDMFNHSLSDNILPTLSYDDNLLMRKNIFHVIYFTIAHEMMHHYQVTTNKLILKNDGSEFYSEWEGFTYRNKEYKGTEYFNLPWELEANNYAIQYLKKIV